LWKGSTPSTPLLVPLMMMWTTTSEVCCRRQRSLAMCIFVEVWHSAQGTCFFQLSLLCWSYRLLSHHVTCWHLNINLNPLVLHFVMLILWRSCALVALHFLSCFLATIVNDIHFTGRARPTLGCLHGMILWPPDLELTSGA
jgi:hypothetical protein